MIRLVVYILACYLRRALRELAAAAVCVAVLLYLWLMLAAAQSIVDGR